MHTLSTTTPEKTTAKPSWLRRVGRFLWDLLTALIAVFLITTFVFQLYGVSGPSMAETLHDGERMFVTKYQYLFNEPQRFDVVVCHYPDRGNENFVKRVVGKPGDTVAIRQGMLEVNGIPYDEPYTEFPYAYVMQPITLGEDQYFVMGDNRMVSNDSRNPDVGPLSRNQILGKVRAVIWPLSEIRTVR